MVTRRLAKPRPVQGEQAPPRLPAEEPGAPLEFLHIDRQSRNGLRSIDQHGNAFSICEFGDCGNWIDRAQGVGDVGNGDKLRPSGDDSRLPWHELTGADAVYFVSGDEGALRRSRLARVVVGASRELRTLKAAAVPLDVKRG